MSRLLGQGPEVRAGGQRRGRGRGPGAGDQAGNEQYGAWREGEHDDLVFAVALAHWGAKRVFPRVAGDDGVWRWDGG